MDRLVVTKGEAEPRQYGSRTDIKYADDDRQVVWQINLVKSF